MWPSGTLNSGKGLLTRWIFTLQRSAMVSVRVDGIGQFAENLSHFVGGLEIKLVGGEFHALAVAHGLASLNAHEDFLGVGIGLREVVAIVGGNEGDAGLLARGGRGRG